MLHAGKLTNEVMEVVMDKVWAGIDAGKECHWAHILDASGTQLLSRRVENDEAELVVLIEVILSLAEDVVLAIDQLVALQRSCWRCCGSAVRG